MAVFREGTNPVWGAFLGVWVLGWLGTDFYWLFTESGPIRPLAAWQAQLFGGSWFPKLSFLLLFIAQIAVLLVIKIGIEAATGKKLTAPVKPEDRLA